MDQTGLWGDWAEGVVFFTENTPPPAPMIDVDPKQGNGNVSCYATPKLFWNEPYDSNGIIGYQVVIDVYNNGSGQWENIINETTASNSFDISFLPSKFCNQWIRAQVEAQDGLGAWGSQRTLTCACGKVQAELLNHRIKSATSFKSLRMSH